MGTRMIVNNALMAGLVAACCISSAAAGESVLLQRKFQDGKTNYVHRTVDMVQKIGGMPGGAMEIKVRSIFGVIEKVKGAAGGKRIVTMTFDRAAQTMDMPMMGELEYDSYDPENEEAAPQLASILQPMVGEALTVEVSKDGKVVGFSGMDAINKKISEKAVANMFWSQVKRQYTDEKARKQWGEDPLLMFPNKEVKVGETWKARSVDDDPQLGVIAHEYEYTLDKITTDQGRKVAHISYKVQISKGESDEGEETPTKVGGGGSGQAVYDIDEGTVVRQTGQGHMDIKMPPPPGMPSEPDQMMSVEISSKSLVRRLSAKEQEQERAEINKKIEARKKAAKEEDDEDSDGGGDDDEDEDEDE